MIRTPPPPIFGACVLTTDNMVYALLIGTSITFSAILYWSLSN